MFLSKLELLLDNFSINVFFSSGELHESAFFSRKLVQLHFTVVDYFYLFKELYDFILLLRIDI